MKRPSENQTSLRDLKERIQLTGRNFIQIKKGKMGNPEQKGSVKQAENSSR
jgi:hypothetical protein